MNYKKFTQKPKLNEGYIALLSVIVIGMVGASIMLSIIFSGIGALKTDIALQHGSQARLAANACGEEALQMILETGTTSSSGGFAVASGTCSYVITSVGGENITINATGLISSLTNKIKVIIATTSPSIVLSSWEEVSDF